MDGKKLPPLLDSIHGLWNSAIKRYKTADRSLEDVQHCVKCLYAGLSLVLPTIYEIRFRLFLAQILLTHTENGTEGIDHIRKSLQLLLTRSEVPIKLKFLAISMWFTCSHPQGGRVHSNQTHVSMLLEARTAAKDAGMMDWLAHLDVICWSQGLFAALVDSCQSGVPHTSLMFVLMFRGQESLSKAQSDALMGGDSNFISWLVALRYAIMQGYQPEASDLCQRLAASFNGLEGHPLPGFIQLDPLSIRNTWGNLVARFSLYLGETPTPITADKLGNILPFYRDALPLEALGENQCSLPALTSRLVEAQKLMLINPKLSLSHLDILAPSLVENPHLESYRLILESLTLFTMREPVHRVKNSLLKALKLLNTQTSNAEFKVLVLLLVGHLYLQTDFEMALKMYHTAFVMAQTAQWPYFLSQSAEGLIQSNRLLGRLEEAKHFEQFVATAIIEPKLSKAETRDTKIPPEPAEIDHFLST